MANAGFEIDEAGDGEKRGLVSGAELSSKILVPFCPESKLSGLGKYALMRNTWYRHFFELPAEMRGKRVRLHFGAVDPQAWVRKQRLAAWRAEILPCGFTMTISGEGRPRQAQSG